jgi:hypothetical protein
MGDFFKPCPKIDKRTDTIPSKNHNTLHLKPLNAKNPTQTP